MWVLSDALDKQLPIVLLLYSYDCPAHERVVIHFANYLQFVANCHVLFDIWDQHQLLSQGIHNWFVDKLDVAQYVIVICSTGARFKCARSRQQQQMKHDRPIPDLFAWAVDQIAEAMRKGKMDGDAFLRYLVVNFEYSSQSDIPPKLDTAIKFSLMKDIFNLYCHLQCLKSDCLPEDMNCDGITEETWDNTECGQGLQEAIRDAKQFFDDNPDWLAQMLEPCSVLPSAALPEETSLESQSSRTKKKKFHKSRSRSLSASDSDKDMLYEHQLKKRHKKAVMKLKKSHSSIESPSPKGLESPVSSQGQSSSSSASSSSPLMYSSAHEKPGNKQLQPLPAVPQHGPVQRSISQPEPGYVSNAPPRKNTSLGSLQHLSSLEYDAEEEEEMDELQLKKDIDFIHNVSVSRRGSEDVLEARGYSPTEGFSTSSSPYHQVAHIQRRNSHLVIDFDLHQPPSGLDNTNTNNSNVNRTKGSPERTRPVVNNHRKKSDSPCIEIKIPDKQLYNNMLTSECDAIVIPL